MSLLDMDDPRKADREKICKWLRALERRLRSSTELERNADIKEHLKARWYMYESIADEIENGTMDRAIVNDEVVELGSDKDHPITTDVPRGDKWCKCAICGRVARCTPGFDYYAGTPERPYKGLRCENCVNR